MVPVLSLWLPIILSAVAVFLLSSVIHMLFGYHHNDYGTLPDEAGVMDVLRPFNLPPGNYAMPHPRDTKDMNSPEYKAKYAKGPVGFLTVLPGGSMAMGKELVQWFCYTLVVGIFAAYIAGRALGPALTTSRRSASPAPPPSLATRSRSGRTPSGTRSTGRRRSSRLSMP